MKLKDVEKMRIVEWTILLTGSFLAATPKGVDLNTILNQETLNGLVNSDLFNQFFEFRKMLPSSKIITFFSTLPMCLDYH